MGPECVRKVKGIGCVMTQIKLSAINFPILNEVYN